MRKTQSYRFKPGLQRAVLVLTLALGWPAYGAFEAKASALEAAASESSAATATKGVVTGYVTDTNGEPSVGATVIEKGNPGNGVTCDIDGKFSIKVPEGAELTVSYIGFMTQNVPTKGRTHVEVTLHESNVQLNEVVVVGYGQQKKISVTGSVASIGTDDLKRSSQPNLSAALSGKLPGLATMQTSGRPGADDVALYLRGASTTNGVDPLILIDGVPRSGISTLDPNEVESVTILKDASATAVFGVRGANGVILITTRRGESGKKELSISFDYSLQQFTTSIDRVHSWDYAALRNQAARNDGVAENALPYTDWMIQQYRNGSDPVFFPDRDIMNEFFKKWAPQTRVNVNMNGGNDKINYFINVGYIGQSGQFKTESKKDLGYDPSYKMNRYTFRSNLDIKPVSNLKISLNLASYLQKVNSPQATDLYGGDIASMTADLMVHAWSTPPTAPGPITAEGYTTPDGTLVPAGKIVSSVYSSDPKNNKYADINRRGYASNTNMNLNSSLAIDWGLDFLTKGLSTKFMVAFDAVSATQLTASRLFDVYQAAPATGPGEKSYYKAVTLNANDVIGAPVRSNPSNYYLNLQYYINYARRFGLNDLGAMVLLQRDHWQNAAADLPYNMLGLSGRVTYNYDQRYLAEFNVGYNGSEQFAKGHRFGLFPAGSIGWVISHEKFMKDIEAISMLKLRASYGKVGNDKLGGTRFLYITNVSMGGGTIPSLGRGQSVIMGKLGNENISWEIAYKQNYGIDLGLFNELTLSFDYFREHRKDILINRGTVPEIQGVPLGNLPKVNMGVVDNSGFEIEARYRKTINSDWSFAVNGNFAYNKNTQKDMDEPIRSDDFAYRYRMTGYSIGQDFGYKIDYSNGNGFINTQEELERAQAMYKVGVPRMGDFLYQDLNGDGYIDEKDMAPILYSNVPRITYGFGAQIFFRDFDLAFHFSGIAKASRCYNAWGAVEYSNEGIYNDWHLNAWTPERYAAGEKITYPALSTKMNTNHLPNDFFIMNRSFLRLKNIEIGYSLPKSLLRKIQVQKVRVYMTGNNLLTWKKIKNNSIDPEQNWEANYPLTKMLNFGVNVVF